MRAQHLGHVVLYVSNLQRSLAFWRDLLGFEQKGEIWNGKAAMLTSGRIHHEVLLIDVGDAPGPLQGHRLGLYHIGICIGDSDDELRAAKAELEEAGVSVTGSADHVITHSLYLHDPDGNEVELYVDIPDYDWESDDEWIEDPIQHLDL